jgi:hypothetical protein
MANVASLSAVVIDPPQARVLFELLRSTKPCDLEELKRKRRG